MSMVYRVGAAALSGLLLVLCLPPVGWWPLAWFALVPLFLACKGQRFLFGFLLGLLASATIGVLSTLGVFFSDKSSNGSSHWIITGCATFGAVIGIISALTAELKTGDTRRILGLAAFAVLFEALTLKVLPVTLALTQPQVDGMRMLSSLLGIWAVSFLLWVTNLLIADAIVQKQPKRVLVPAAALVLLMLAGPLWSGAGRDGATSPIVLVQAPPEGSPDHLAKMSGTNPAALAIWPEFGGLQGAPRGDTETLKLLSQGGPAFVTSFQDGNRPLPRNVASLFSQGSESKRYAKRLLFGGEAQMHVEGSEARVVPWNDVLVGLNICFDSCAPGVIRETAAPDGVRLIALPTIDPPSPHHWMAAMHAAFTPFRAAEAGVPVARADGYAYSMVADASGEVLAVLPPGERSLEVPVPLTRRWTLYRLMGNAFLVFCGCLVVWSLIPIRRKDLPRQVSAAQKDLL